MKKYKFGLADKNLRNEEAKIVDGVKMYKIPKMVIESEDGTQYTHPAFVKDGNEIDYLYYSEPLQIKDTSDLRNLKDKITTFYQEHAIHLYEQFFKNNKKEDQK